MRGGDLSMAFLQIVLTATDSLYCGFVVDGQCYVMSRLLFGLKSSPAGRLLSLVAREVHSIRF